MFLKGDCVTHENWPGGKGRIGKVIYADQHILTVDFGQDQEFTFEQKYQWLRKVEKDAS